MPYTVISAAASEPITVAEARAQCQIDGTDHDAVLAVFIAAARAKCEALIDKALITRTVEQSFDSFPVAEILLDGTPAASVSSVIYTDVNGADQTLSSLLYTLDTTKTHKHYLVPAYDTEWPDTREQINAVRVRYVIGYGSTLPAALADVKAWLLMTVAYLFANREAFDVTGRTADIPSRFVDSLLDPWRNYGPM